jgi:hypothetical protein
MCAGDKAQKRAGRRNSNKDMIMDHDSFNVLSLTLTASNPPISHLRRAVLSETGTPVEPTNFAQPPKTQYDVRSSLSVPFVTHSHSPTFRHSLTHSLTHTRPSLPSPNLLRRAASHRLVHSSSAT